MAAAHFLFVEPDEQLMPIASAGKCCFPSRKFKRSKCVGSSVCRDFLQHETFYGAMRGGSLIFDGARAPWHVTNLPRNSIPTATGDNYRPRCLLLAHRHLFAFSVQPHRWLSRLLLFSLLSYRYSFLLLLLFLLCPSYTCVSFCTHFLSPDFQPRPLSLSHILLHLYSAPSLSFLFPLCLDLGLGFLFVFFCCILSFYFFNLLYFLVVLFSFHLLFPMYYNSPFCILLLYISLVLNLCFVQYLPTCFDYFLIVSRCILHIYPYISSFNFSPVLFL